jgi:hypothetical protein
MRAATALGLVGLALACGDAGRGGPRAFPVPGERGPRITVEVLNASGTPGLARGGTRVLRRAGIDVVYLGNAPADVGTLDSTRILVRRGDAAAGARVREALGVGRVEAAPAPERLLDVSVLLGADFAARLQRHP